MLHEAFTTLLDELVTPFQSDTIHVVAGIDALGFILGTAVAMRLGVGFVPIRKAGKLPSTTRQITFVDYSEQSKALEVRVDAFAPGMRVLLVDEWVETGAQLGAAVKLIEELGGHVAGIATINIDANPQTEALRRAYKCHSLQSPRAP